MKALRLTLATTLLTALAACSSIDCDLQGRVLCHYAFIGQSDEESSISAPLSITLNREAVDSDTVYINQQSGLTTFDLPMSYNLDTDRITMTVYVNDSTELSDVITVTKTNEPTFESVDCSPRYHHTITAVSSTHTIIDTVIVNNPKVSNDASVTNIQIRLSDTNL